MNWLLLASALAGDLFVNDKRILPESMAGIYLEDVNVRFDSEGNMYVDASAYQISVATQDSAPAPQPKTPTVVAVERWWMVTEDNATLGHAATVRVNGQAVHTVRSGDPQKLLDLAPFLQPGLNAVSIQTQSTNAGGGSLFIYIGTGSNAGGTVTLDNPMIQMGLGPSSQAAETRDFTLDVK
jgi:hypothetical protein